MAKGSKKIIGFQVTYLSMVQQVLLVIMQKNSSMDRELLLVVKAMWGVCFGLIVISILSIPYFIYALTFLSTMYISIFASKTSSTVMQLYLV